MTNDTGLPEKLKNIIETDNIVSTIAYKSVALMVYASAIVFLIIIFQIVMAWINETPFEWTKYASYYLWVIATIIPIQIALALSEVLKMYELWMRKDLTPEQTRNSIRKDALMIHFANFASHVVNIGTFLVALFLYFGLFNKISPFHEIMTELNSGALLNSTQTMLIFGLVSVTYAFLTIFAIKKSAYIKKFKMTYAVANSE